MLCRGISRNKIHHRERCQAKLGYKHICTTTPRSDNKVEFVTATRMCSPAFSDCPPHDSNEGHAKSSDEGKQDENVAVHRVVSS
jgi:hypothetical protein